jgi:gamma-glutamyltranspeptidase/glutathione hydrolase
MKRWCAVLTVLSILASGSVAWAGAMVVTAQHEATDAGLAILKAGGNAVDAAVAVGFAEAVTNPCCGNIGGGGFMLLQLKGHGAVVIDFRETAPTAATAAMYLGDAGNPVPGGSLFGYKAVGVPGTVLGLDTALRRYGRLTRAQVMAPAIRLARNGFILTQGDTDILDGQVARIRKDRVLAKIFLRSDGTPLRPGDRLVQAELASTLEQIARKGPNYFYRGPVARRIAQASAAGGGILTAKDFANYRVSQDVPLACRYRGYDVLSVRPPSSGGVTLCQILGILEGYDLKALRYRSPASVRLLIEAMRYAYADRNDALGDPAFVNNPLQQLLSSDHIAQIRARINAGASPPAYIAVVNEKPETTHYSILDADGNAASVTYTLNGSFGALVMAPGTGVLLNDEMDDFTVKPGVANQFGLVQGAKNAIAPGKRPLSSMSPTLVMKDGKPVLVLGSPGGARIITATLEALINVIDYGMSPQAAVDTPRLHYQGTPNVVYLEKGALKPAVRATLEKEGYHFEEQAPWCAVEMIRATPHLEGANDYRRPAGAAAGY